MTNILSDGSREFLSGTWFLSCRWSLSKPEFQSFCLYIFQGALQS